VVFPAMIDLFGQPAAQRQAARELANDGVRANG